MFHPNRNRRSLTTLAASLATAAVVAATAALPANAAEPFDAGCEQDPERSHPVPLIVTGFKTDSAAVPGKQEDEIAAYARNLAHEAKVCVVGQADKRGPLAHNDKLAMKRARAVAARLIKAGVAPEVLSLSSRAEAFGDAAPDWLWFDGSRRVEVLAVD